jgi:hypothetical protein
MVAQVIMQMSLEGKVVLANCCRMVWGSELEIYLGGAMMAVLFGLLSGG